MEEIKQYSKDYISLKSELMGWIKVIMTAFVIALTITTFIVKPTLVIGSSMYPTLEDKDYLIISRMAYLSQNPKRGEIIVFYSNLQDDRVLIKRVIATEGDKVVVENNKVYVNNKLIDEPYINGHETIGIVNQTVPKNSVFVMGDNRGNSLDSRFQEVGFVAKDEIIGKVIIRLLPFTNIKTF